MGNLGVGASAPTKGRLQVDGNIAIGGSNNELRFYEGANYIGFEAPVLSADKIWVLPTADGASGQVIKTDGTGSLSWASHNDLDGLQGGVANEYYHLDNSDYTALSDANAQLEDLQIDGSPSFSGLTIDTLSGVLKATTGVVSGSATMDDIADGVTYVRSHNDFTDTYKGYLNQGVKNVDAPIFAGLTVDTNTIYVDSVNHLVGIGTTSPDYALQVGHDADPGTIYTYGLYINEGNAEEGKVLTSLNDEGLVYWKSLSEIQGVSGPEGGGTSNVIPKWDPADPTGSTLVDSNLIYESGGQIGIGTTVPSAKTHILQTTTADAFRVDDEASDITPFIIDKDGNVGIGTTTLGANKLKVEGSIYSSNLVDTASLRVRDGAHTGYVLTDITVHNSQFSGSRVRCPNSNASI